MPKFYRPPFGICNTENLSMAKEFGYKISSGALPVWLAIKMLKIKF